MNAEEWKPVQVAAGTALENTGRAKTQSHTSRDAFFRGFKKAGKIVAGAVLAALPFAFVEPFLFMVWGSVLFIVLFFGVGPYIHYKYWSERLSFSLVEGICPSCKEKQELKPYLSTRFDREFTVLCPNCGQTTAVMASNT